MKVQLKSYSRLTPQEQAIFQVIAVHQEGLTVSDLTTMLKGMKTGEPGLWPDLPKAAAVREMVERIVSSGLVERAPSFSRFTTSDAARDFGIQQAALSGRLPLLERLMRSSRRINDKSYGRLAHEALARCAFYHGNVDAFSDYCDKLGRPTNRLVHLGLMQTWEPQLFQLLPEPFQRETLNSVLVRMLKGKAKSVALEQFKAVVLSDQPAASQWADLRVQWLFAAGDIEQLDRLTQTDSPVKELATCAAAFLRGNSAAAEESLNKYVAARKAKPQTVDSKTDRSVDPLAGPITVLIHFLLTLRQDSNTLRKSLKMLNSKAEKEDSLFKSLVTFATELADYSVSMESSQLGRLKKLVSDNSSKASRFSYSLIAHLWRWFISDHPFPCPVPNEELTALYRQHGLCWLAAVCEDAHAMRRLNKDHARPTGELHRKLGTFPMLEWIKPPEIWKQKLEVLRRVVAKHTATPGQILEESAVFDERMIWELVVTRHANHVNIENLRPLIQARSGKGWTKGRPIALGRLHNCSFAKEYPYLTPQDIAVCKCIETYAVPSGYYDNTDTKYALNVGRALEALIGHPLVFPADERKKTIELVRREPELVIESSKIGYRLVLSPTPPGEQTVILCADGPDRFAVVLFTPAQSQLAQVLDEGIEVPVAGQAELFATAQALSHVAAVQSAVSLATATAGSPTSKAGASAGNSSIEQGTARSVVTHSDILVQLTPYQEGVRAEFLVRPFGTQGPMFAPAVGGKSILTVVDQEQLVTERDFRAERERLTSIIERCPSLAGAQGSLLSAVDLPTAEQALELVSELEPLHEQGLVTVFWPQGQKLRVAGRVDKRQLRISINSDKDWFAASGKLEYDKNSSIDLTQLIDLLSARTSNFVPLSDGRFLRLSEQLRQRVAELAAYSERRNDTLRFPPIRAFALEDIDQWCTLKAGKAWKERQQRIREAIEREFTLPSTLNATLRDYQMEGYQWLCRLAHWGAGACLADDMGLGKTLQAIALLLHRAADGPALVVAPTSLGFNWQNELFRFAPTLNVHLFGGGDRKSSLADLGPRDVVITTYGLLQNEVGILSKVAWHTVVLDEAQAIKNMATKRSQAAMELKANFRLILTGTPIENHLGELWNLMQFLNPGLLGSSDAFQNRFAIPIERDHDREAQQRLKRLVQPFLLRRTKSQVLTELPARTEVTIGVTLSDDEALLYEAARQRAVKELAEAAQSKQGQHVRILAELMRLRRACCHPRLLLPETTLPGSKLEAFSHTIDEMLANQHKALVFSQFVDHLAILREELDRKGIVYQYLDGSTPAKERRVRVEAFQDGQGDVFLISLKAGGTGLNLTAADYVLHMDPWWNPAVEDQAADRAHRIGQQRPVTIYRFITLGTIEEKIVQLHQTKRDLADRLLEGAESSSRLSAEELMELIKLPTERVS